MSRQSMLSSQSQRVAQPIMTSSRPDHGRSLNPLRVKRIVEEPQHLICCVPEILANPPLQAGTRPRHGT